MNHNQSYSTVPHIPASRLQDADGSMRPHTYGVHPRPCAVIATEPYRPTVCAGEHPYPAAYTATAHYSLLTASSPAATPAPPVPLIQHSALDIYTFSAKEKDSETGLSYFGSRYYSSDLSIWLSVDPMSDKYPSLSPYTYCANNPVKVVDPNGEEIVGTDGKAVTYSYNEKGDVVWSTNASDDTKRIGNAMLQTETGKEQLDFLISGTKTKITMKISADNRGDVMGEMIPGKATKNKDGSIDLNPHCSNPQS